MRMFYFSEMITEIADRYFSLNVIVGPSKISISDIDVTGRRRLYMHCLKLKAKTTPKYWPHEREKNYKINKNRLKCTSTPTVPKYRKGYIFNEFLKSDNICTKWCFDFPQLETKLQCFYSFTNKSCYTKVIISKIIKISKPQLKMDIK